VMGQPVTVLLAESQAEDGFYALERALRQKQEFRQLVLRLRTDGRQSCVAAFSGKPVFNPKRQFVGYRGTGRDITLIQKNQEKLAEANQNFGDSVAYASHFQHRLLADESALNADFDSARFVWQPRDLVGGDFLTQFYIKDVSYVAFYDCTGHGVPGGFMVMLVTAAIDRIRLRAKKQLSCDQILHAIHNEICQALGITRGQSATDGLDCAVISRRAGAGHFSYAGANIDLFAVAADGQVERFSSLRRSLGYRYHHPPLPFKTHRIKIDGRCFVLFTDGLSTQIGGTPRRVMGTDQIIDMMAGAQDTDPRRLVNIIMRGLRQWQGHEHRRDDVMLLSLRPLAKKK